MNVFDRYSPFIQDFIYKNGWSTLRGVQQAAGEAIFGTSNHVLITASTASGKTEAAFFPILTIIDEEQPKSVGALYIAPLKALINDQFERLTELCEEAHIPVTKWHGDASASDKRKLLKHPRGIVQITPESLESLLINKHSELPSLFHDLRFIIIDEIHSLLRGDRGLQTFCLIQRLCRLAGCRPRRIGLSATIGKPRQAAEFMASGDPRPAIIPRFDGGTETWRISMQHFMIKDPQQPPEERAEQPAKNEDAQTQKASGSVLAMADPGWAYIFEHTRGKKCLIFSNSREECETVCQSLRRYCELTHAPDRFLIHHGNLSASYREGAEEEMKEDESLNSVCCTATLELGIDVGRLERAFQIEAPYTVSSFLQRMGRTGRRGTPSEMWFVIREMEHEPRDLMPNTLPWHLIQAVALVQLYVEKRFVEPPRTDRLPYSLLYHQTMSTVASCGEMTPAELASRVLTLSPFHRVTQDDYRLLLHHLIEIDHLNITENRGLILGLAGEQIVSNYKFYAVFQENVEYAVRSQSEDIGTVVKPPPQGELLAIAGKVWVIDEIDYYRHIVYVTEIKGQIPAYFGDVPGDIDTRILERMYQVFIEEQSYPYLLTNAKKRLSEGRESFIQAGLPCTPLINLGENTWALFPWLGTYSFMALERFLRLICAPHLKLKGFYSYKPYFMIFTMSCSAAEFFAVTSKLAAEPFDPLALIFPGEVPHFDKYDEYLPEELVCKGFACGVLDIQGMKERVLSWTYKERPQLEEGAPFLKYDERALNDKQEEPPLNNILDSIKKKSGPNSEES